MILNKRERVLAVVVAALLVVVVGWQVFAAIADPLGQLRAQRTNLANDLERKTRDKEALDKAKERLEEWQRRSLPSEAESARVLYRDWLSDLAGKSFSSGFNLGRPEVTPRGDFFNKLRVVVHTQGTLDQLTGFLHGFYSAGHLHMVYSLVIEPVEKSGEMKFTITVDSLILPGADRRKELSKEPGNRLASADVAAYKVIAERNLFAPYAPPKPPVLAKAPPEPKPEFDPSRYAYATAIVGGRDGRLEVWLRKRTTDETLTLHEGDPLEVGPFKGMVARIGPREFEIRLEGEPKPYVVPIGDNLRGTESAAKPAASEGPAAKPDVKPGGPPEVKPGGPPETGARPKFEFKREGGPNNKMDFRRRGPKKSRGDRETEK